MTRSGAAVSSLSPAPDLPAAPQTPFTLKPGSGRLLCAAGTDLQERLMAGRPSVFSEEVAGTICARLASGESLRTICADEDLPAERTVYGWLSWNEEFSQQYARARKCWADAQIEEIRAIARDDTRAADHKRLEIDTLKWAMGKLNGKYSDKVKHVGGDEGDAPIRTVTGIEWTVVTPEA